MYKFDFEQLEMIDQLIHKVLNGDHKGDDVQKDLSLAQHGLDMIVEQMVRNKQKEIEDQKRKSLTSIMKESLMLYDQDFESSTNDTKQFIQFYRTFKREFTKLVKPFTDKIEFSKGHFDLTIFIELKDKRIFYISLGDLRWDKGTILIRTATSFKDYTGGSNDYLTFDNDFDNKLKKYLGVENGS